MNPSVTNSRKILMQILACLCIFSLAQAQPFYHYIPNQNDLLQKTEASVVLITGEDAKGQQIAPAKGFFVSGKLIATDYMAIKDAIQIHVQTSSQEIKDASVVAVDSSRSVALLHFFGTALPSLKLACPPEPTAGTMLYLTGNSPQSDGMPSQASVTDTQQKTGRQYLQLNVTLSSDKSGSPVVNQQGEVLGFVARSAPGQQSSNLVVPVIYLTSLMLSRPPCETDKPQKSAEGGVEGGVPGGVPGGVYGVVGGVGKGAPASAQVIRKSGGVLVGSALRRAEPIYPPLAKAARVSGAVVVEVTVDEEGDVLSARALSGHPLLKESAAAAARGWKFTPTTLQGTPVKVVGTITFNFSL
jgi:TonB family protein